MNDEIKSTAPAISDFDEIVSYVKNDKSDVEGNIYIGSKFLIVCGCNPSSRSEGLSGSALSVW